MKLAPSISLIAAALLGTANAWAADTAVRLDGAIATRALAEAAQRGWRPQPGGGEVDIKLHGSANALDRLCRGLVDVVLSTTAMDPAGREQCERQGVPLIEASVARDALAVVVNPRNSFVRSLSLDELKAMWSADAQGKVISWKQVNAAWPDQPLKLYGPGAQYGDASFFNQVVTGDVAGARLDYSASDDDRVLSHAVLRDSGALAYVSLSNLQANAARMRPVPLTARAGAAPVAPTVENLVNGSYQTLSRPVRLYVSVKSLARPDVRSFVEHLLDQGPQIARDGRYAPVPTAAYRTALDQVRAIPAAVPAAPVRQ